MTAATSFDIRLPTGAVHRARIGRRRIRAGHERGCRALRGSLGVNINLWWGLVMLAFGVLLLVAASRTGRAASARPSTESVEGDSTEARERRLGLEGGNRQE